VPLLPLLMRWPKSRKSMCHSRPPRKRREHPRFLESPPLKTKAISPIFAAGLLALSPPDGLLGILHIPLVVAYPRPCRRSRIAPALTGTHRSRPRRAD
jgi:hypothetical protein